MKAFLVGTYKWANRGDAALVLTFIVWLRSLGIQPSGMTSFDPIGDQPHYDIPLYSMPIPPPGRWRMLLERQLSKANLARVALARVRILMAWLALAYFPAWARLYRQHPNIARVLCTRSTHRAAKGLAAADVVVGVPGGYFLAPREIDDWWLLHLPSFLIARGLGKKTILGPCSIGPFDQAHRRIAGAFLQKLDLVIVRERESAQILKGLGFPEDRITFSPDMAFLYSCAVPTSEPVDFKDILRALAVKHSGLVGVSVRNHSFPGWADPEARMAAYVRGVADTLRRLSALGAGILLVHQTEEDVEVTSRLAAELSRIFVPHVVLDPSLGPCELLQVYGDLDLLIGTRMHANILAMSAGTPIVGIGYEPKTIGILTDLGLRDWGLWIDEVVDGKLWLAVQNSWTNRSANGAVLPSVLRDIKVRFDRLGEALLTEVGSS